MIIDWKFKKEYACDNTQMWTSVTGQVDWDGLQESIKPKSLDKIKIEKAIQMKIEDQSKPEYVTACAKMIIDKYDHYIKQYFEKLENIPAIKERKQL